MSKEKGPCTFILTMGRRKGQPCGKENSVRKAKDGNPHLFCKYHQERVDSWIDEGKGKWVQRELNGEMRGWWCQTEGIPYFHDAEIMKHVRSGTYISGTPTESAKQHIPELMSLESSANTSPESIKTPTPVETVTRPEQKPVESPPVQNNYHKPSTPSPQLIVVDTPLPQATEKKPSASSYVYYPPNTDTEQFIKETDSSIEINVKAIRAAKRSGKGLPAQTSRSDTQSSPEIIEDVDEIAFVDSDEEYDIDDIEDVVLDDEGEVKEFTAEELDAMERQIQRYYQAFPILNETIPPESRGGMHPVKWLKELRIQVAMNKSSILVHNGFNCTMQFIGGVADVEPDFSQMVNPDKNEDIRDLLTEVELEYLPTIAELTPTQRLMGTIGFSLVMAMQVKHQREKSSPSVKRSPAFTE